VSELGRVIGRLYIQEVWLSHSSDAAWEIGAAYVSSTHRLLHVLSKHLPVGCQHVGSFLVQGVVRIRLLQNSSINSESCHDIQLVIRLYSTGAVPFNSPKQLLNLIFIITLFILFTV